MNFSRSQGFSLECWTINSSLVGEQKWCTIPQPSPSPHPYTHRFSYQRITLTCKCLAHCVLVLFIRSNFGLTFLQWKKKLARVPMWTFCFLGKITLYGIYLVHHIKILSTDYLAQCKNLFPLSCLNVMEFGTKQEIPRFTNLARASLPWSHI